MMTALRSLLAHAQQMAGQEQDERLRAQWAVMAEEIRAYLSPATSGEPLPGL